MGVIEHIHSRQILDSRGNPTLEVDVLSKEVLEELQFHLGHQLESEAVELRDLDNGIYKGKGVLKLLIM